MKKLKRLIVCMIVLVSIFSLTACVDTTCIHEWGGNDCTVNSSCKLCGEVRNAIGHDYNIVVNEPTCNNGGYTTYTCKNCSDTYKDNYTDKKGHTLVNWVCSVCGDDQRIWKQAFYVDEFNNPTDETYITTKEYCVGTFSNSATTNSKLKACFLIDNNRVAIVLLEYGSLRVKAYSYTSYDIIMQTDDGVKTNLKGEMYKQGDRVYITDLYENTVINALKTSKSVSFYLKDNVSVSSSYLFTVETGNFADIYATLTNTAI